MVMQYQSLRNRTEKENKMEKIPPPIHDYSVYTEQVKSRTRIHYLLGLITRWRQYFKYAKAVKIARKNGATIGEGVIMPLS